MNFSLIAKYRSEMMGIAILNVLVLHSLSWINPNPSFWVTALNTFGRLIFTEGFLFLSGFGLYYSLHRNYSLCSFYRKRVQRLMVPYWLMTLPFFIAYCIIGRYGLGTLFLRITTLDFWVHGNYAGMWYVAISAFLYACFPLIFNVLRRNGVGLLLLVSVSIIVAVHYVVPRYYEMTSIGIAKIPFFIIGAWAGKMSVDENRLDGKWILLLFFILVILYAYPICSWLNVREWFFRLSGMVICCYLLKLTQQWNLAHSILRWFGKYTLELYIIHLLFKGAISDYTISGTMQSILAIGIALLLCVPVHTFCDVLNNKMLIISNDNY